MYLRSSCMKLVWSEKFTVSYNIKRNGLILPRTNREAPAFTPLLQLTVKKVATKRLSIVDQFEAHNKYITSYTSLRPLSSAPPIITLALKAELTTLKHDWIFLFHGRGIKITSSIQNKAGKAVQPHLLDSEEILPGSEIK